MSREIRSNRPSQSIRYVVRRAQRMTPRPLRQWSGGKAVILPGGAGPASSRPQCGIEIHVFRFGKEVRYAVAKTLAGFLGDGPANQAIAKVRIGIARAGSELLFRNGKHGTIVAARQACHRIACHGSVPTATMLKQLPNRRAFDLLVEIENAQRSSGGDGLRKAVQWPDHIK